jgi:hypothetical protein
MAWGGSRPGSGRKRGSSPNSKTPKSGKWGGARPGAGARPTRPRETGGCCVYIVHEVNNPEICKIGVTGNSAYTRLSGLQTGNWRSLILVSTVVVGDEKQATRIEKIVHEKLREFHVSGEWFRSSPPQILKLIGEAMVEVAAIEVQRELT